MDASSEVLRIPGSAYEGSLNFYPAAGSAVPVATVQVDTWVYVVYPDSFDVHRIALEDWIGRDPETGRVEESRAVEADDADQAWELLAAVRGDAYLWQCGACDAWIHTTDRPRIGVLQCSTGGDGGVDFRHADRHA